MKVYKVGIIMNGVTGAWVQTSTCSVQSLK